MMLSGGFPSPSLSPSPSPSWGMSSAAGTSEFQQQQQQQQECVGSSGSSSANGVGKRPPVTRSRGSVRDGKLSSFERRQGKWTRAECDYAMLLIEHFTSGRLPGCSGGESLRTTLSECLMCTPMRITKKLSATHAIGKCCFKKKGELTAKERVDLEAARSAFASSVEKRGGRVEESSGPRKRTRVDDEWLCGDLVDGAWLEDSGSLSALSEDGDDKAKRWASPHASAGNSEPLPPSVSARLTPEGKTAVRVVVGDRPGLIGEISAAFKRRGLSIAGCVAETLPGDVAHDEFEVVYAESKLAVTADTELRSLERYLEKALVDASGDDDAASESSSVRTKCSNVDVPKKISATTLQVTVPDRPGLLKQITTSLASLSLSIVGAKIETVEADDETAKTALDTFDVVDAESGGPVLDPVRLRAIEERLARDLEATPLEEERFDAPASAQYQRYDYPAFSRQTTTTTTSEEDDQSWALFSRKYFQ